MNLRMRNLSAGRRLALWLIVVAIAAVLLAGMYFTRFKIGKPLAPTIPSVSSCINLAPGARRIGEQYGFQFDVRPSDFNITEGTQDTPPFVHRFGLRPNSTVSVLEISLGNRPMESMALDPASTFSSHAERRRILDDQGRPVGEDYWGYLSSGERWRQVRLFKGGVVAKYGFVSKEQAELFDRVIDSVCFLPSSSN